MPYPNSIGMDKLINVFFRPILSRIEKAKGPAITPPSRNKDPIHGTRTSGTSVMSHSSSHSSGSIFGSVGDDQPMPHPQEKEPNVAEKIKILYYLFSTIKVYLHSFFSRVKRKKNVQIYFSSRAREGGTGMAR